MYFDSKIITWILKNSLLGPMFSRELSLLALLFFCFLFFVVFCCLFVCLFSTENAMSSLLSHNLRGDRGAMGLKSSSMASNLL